MLFPNKKIVQHIIAKACQEPRWNLICARGGVSLEQVSGLKEFFERGKRNFPILKNFFRPEPNFPSGEAIIVVVLESIQVC